MPYLTIDPGSLAVSVVRARPVTGVSIPTDPEKIDVLAGALANTAYFGGCYRYWSSKQPRGSKAKASLAPPDPWLIAVVGVMWEGLLQGASWDVIKAAVLAAVSKLRSSGLAPQSDASVTKRLSRSGTREVGFSWKQFSEEGKPLWEFFLGIRSKFKESTEVERIRVTRPQEFERLRAKHRKELTSKKAQSSATAQRRRRSRSSN